ncbi:MAG: molybdate ABC transporter permease subunit [Lachnospiraceae bacterium]|nr:molybdate ABC transporter permease subunit [Lachnospiraceae bacterium]
MDLYPLFNSIRIALISTAVVLVFGVAAAYLVVRLPRFLKGVLDSLFTLPLVLPPTVVGYLLILLLGPKRPVGAWFLEVFGVKLTMNWWSAVFATTVIIFPLMYRTSRGAFEAFDRTYEQAGQTLGLGRAFIFFRIILPCCKAGIIAGVVLSFARALGEYGATMMISGYTPGRTATISTTVYQMWRTDNEALAAQWVLINIAISTVVLLAINIAEGKQKDITKKEHSLCAWITGKL